VTFQKALAGASRLRDDVVIVNTVLHEFAETLGEAVDAKDGHTWRHSEEVALVSRALALALRLSPVEADVIHVAGHLHDVGKIGVPDAVLLKPGPLTDEEWILMRRHPVIGADIVRPVRSLRECGVLEMILHHHERFDGRGYPDGLRGDDIPLGARIIAVADSISAMLQKRPYRRNISFAKAQQEILDNAGAQFDPQVVGAFYDIRLSVQQTIRNCNADDPGLPTRKLHANPGLL
jgi:response regulator RpfG family c-di-GMP phosphodiesterase